MANVPKPNDLGTRLVELERRIGVLERTSRLNSASIGRGGLTVRDGGVITIKDPGDLIMEDADGDEIWSAKANLSTYGWVDAANPSAMDISTAWTDYGADASTQITVPDGFRYGHFLMFVSAGETFDNVAGNISVQPVFEAGDGTTWTQAYGPPVNSGSTPSNGGAAVASSVWARNFYNVGAPTWPFIRLRLRAVRAGAVVPNNGNWHVAASVVYTREPL